MLMHLEMKSACSLLRSQTDWDQITPKIGKKIQVQRVSGGTAIDCIRGQRRQVEFDANIRLVEKSSPLKSDHSKLCKQNPMNKVSGFSVQVSVLFFFPDT